MRGVSLFGLSKKHERLRVPNQLKIPPDYAMIFSRKIMDQEVTRLLEIPKLLIADVVEEFSQALAERVRGSYRIRVCKEGRETLDMILAFKPDIVVMDMLLPGLDGVTILEEAYRAGIRPVVLATSKMQSDYIIHSAERLEVSYLMIKPCSVRAAAERLRDITEHLHAPAVSRPEPRTEVANMLLALNFSTKLRGYAYLREAILEYRNRPGQSVTKELYPLVGKICDASGSQVERSIRSAIEKAWEQRDECTWRLYFQSNAMGQLKRPTNGELITALADRMEREWGKPETSP